MTLVAMTNDHISDETLAAFIDGRADPETRERVIEHMDACDDCRATCESVADYLALEADGKRPDAESSVVRGRFASRNWFRYTAAAAVIVGVVALWPVGSRFLHRSTQINDVVEASETLKARPIRARLSGGFPYRPFIGPKRGGETGAPADSAEWGLYATGARIEADLDKNRSSENLHALGLSQLLLKNYNEAITALEEALAIETHEPDRTRAVALSTNPSLLNDLAAAYYSRFEARGSQDDQAQALFTVQAAWRLKKSPEAAWTRALVIESLHIREDAVAAWHEFLTLEGDSQWSVEARQHLKDLSEPTDAELWPSVRERIVHGAMSANELSVAVSRFRQQTRLLIEDELLPAWGRAFVAGDAAAAQRLAAVAAAADALRTGCDERFASDAVAAIRRASPTDVVRLARGHAAYGAGRQEMLAYDAARAVVDMSKAVAELPASLTPFGIRAEAERAAAVYLQNDYPNALTAFQHLLARPLRPPSAAFEGRLQWAVGLLQLQTGNTSAAIDHYRKAVAAYERAGEIDHQAAVHSLLADALESAGAAVEAARERDDALGLLQRSGNDTRRHSVIFEAAYAAILKDQSAVADLLLDRVVTHDKAVSGPVAACTSLMWRSAYQAHRGALDSAARDLSDARHYCTSIADIAVKERSVANLVIAQAVLQTRSKMDVTAAELDAAIGYYERTKSVTWLRTAYLARANVSARRGDYVRAERDFRAAVAQVELQREEFEEPDARISFTAGSDDVFDGYIGFLADRGRSRDALEVADNSRARQMIDSPAARWGNVTRGRHSAPSWYRCPPQRP